MLKGYFKMCGTNQIVEEEIIGARGDNVLLRDSRGREGWNSKSSTFLTAAQAAAKVCSCVSCGARRLEDKAKGELDEQAVRNRVIQEIHDLSENEPISRLMLSVYAKLGWDYHGLDELLELRDRVAEALELRLELQVFSTMREA